MALPYPGCLPFLSTFFLLTAPSLGPRFPSQPGCVWGDLSSHMKAFSPRCRWVWVPLGDGQALGGLPGSVARSAVCPQPFSWACHTTSLCLHFLILKMGMPLWSQYPLLRVSVGVAAAWIVIIVPKGLPSRVRQGHCRHSALTLRVY